MKKKIRYIFAGIFIIGSIVEYKEYGILVSILSVLLGISLMPIIYEKFLKIKKLPVIIPIVLLITIGLVLPRSEDLSINTNSEMKKVETNRNTTEKKQTKNKKEEKKKTKKEKVKKKESKEKTSEENEQPKYEISDTLTNIAQVYYDNEARGNANYFSKKIRVTAKIKRIDVDDSVFFNTGITIHLYEKGAKYTLMCQNDNGMVGITKYSREDDIAVIGTMETMVGNSLWLKDCIIDE